ncbi:hypothetical protein GA707_14450 [Nostocoides sp. F2B08]|uniref:hypothetical protein n=1 Tax=Nostocoides sp. F2B08 TaxID=2653936 RepID=UPI001263ABF7|nr:hypothetical protein [Tetrasphaera sp. F2B08]KAB7743298.1 hypothetical protein GA707_14450 [Tetrasphaera sp. F2B08]
MDTTVSRQRRRLLRTPVLLVVAALLAVLAPQTCAACSCLAMTFEEASAQADVIFVGTVTSRDAAPNGEFGAMLDYTFEVGDVYKGGPVAQDAVVRTADNSAACGFPFEEGGTYLVMASSSADGLETNLCTGSAGLADVPDSDLDALGAPLAPVAGPPAADGDAGPSGWAVTRTGWLWLGAGVAAAAVGTLILALRRPWQGTARTT